MAIVNSLLLNLRSGDSGGTADFRLQMKDGSWEWANSRARILSRDADGKTVLILVTLSLITERKQAEEELRRANAYNRGLLEASLDPLVTIGLDGKITDVNLGTEQITGYSRAELIGTDFSDYFTDPERARKGYQAAFQEGSVRHYFLEIRHRDGSSLPVRYNAAVYRDPAGKVAGVIASARDITRLKQAEDALRRASAYNRGLLEASLDPLVTIGPDGKITDVNAATEQATGHSRKELVGTDFSDYFTDPEQARRGYQRVFQEGSVRDYPLEIRRRDGSSVPVLYNAAVYRDHQGSVAGVFAAARDITELLRVQNELEKANEVLEQRVLERTAELEAANLALRDALRVKDKFIAAMSHELRTPMNSILGFTQVLLNDGAVEAGSRKYVETIQQSGENLLSMINDILEISRINAGQLSFDPVSFNLRQLLYHMRDTFHARAAARNLTLKIELDPGLIEIIFSDETKIAGILHQLLDNAIKFTPQGGITLRCRTEKNLQEEDPDQILLSLDVEDTGVEIPPEVLPVLFKPFEQTRDAEKMISGLGFTGLGLAISQNYARLMGGEITVTSTPGVGSCFQVRLAVRKHGTVESIPAEMETVHEEGKNQPDSTTVEAPAITAIPPALLKKMKAAAVNGDFYELMGLIQETSTYSPRLADKLRNLTNDYQLDALIHLFEGGQTN